MTNQMQAQLDFLEKNLTKKEKRYKRTKRFFSKLPGFRWTLRRQERGIAKIEKDIRNKEIEIIQMQQDDQIFIIIPTDNLSVTFGMGYLPDPEDDRDYDEPQKLAALRMKAPQWTPPAHIIDQSKFTSIKNQLSIGACTAFAGCSQLEYYVKRKTGKDTNLSELFLYLETRRNLGWEKEDTGAYLRTTMKTMASIGTCLESEWPYDIAKFTENPPAHVYPRADDYKASSYFKIDKKQYSKDQVLNRIRSALNRDLPLIFGFTCYDETLKQATSTGDIPYPTSQAKVSGGHAVLLVGYDDGRVITNTKDGSKTTGAFIIRNSWGKNWGDQGRGAIPYAYLTNSKLRDIWCLIRAEYMNESRFD